MIPILILLITYCIIGVISFRETDVCIDDMIDEYEKQIKAIKGVPMLTVKTVYENVTDIELELQTRAGMLEDGDPLKDRLYDASRKFYEYKTSLSVADASHPIFLWN